MRKVVITGASSGIGLCLASHFELQGALVLRIDRKRGYDLRTINGIQDAIGRIHGAAEGDPVDILINNAGVMLPFEEDLNWDDGEDMIRVNLTAVWHLMRALNMTSPGGNIINIASIAGINHDADTALYSATKAGVISLTKAYAKLYASKGIRVNSISPGLFCTNLVPEPTPDSIINRVPLGYEEMPNKLIPVVDLLINTEYMTGSNIVIDGGFSL